MKGTIGAFSCDSTCACTPPPTTWSPPTPPPSSSDPPCDFEPFCDLTDLLASELSVWIQLGEEEDACFSCDACDSAPIELLLPIFDGTGGGSITVDTSLLDDCDSTADYDALDDWLLGNDLDPNCAVGGFGGIADFTRECDRIDEGCDVPAHTVTNTTAYFGGVIFRDGTYRAVLVVQTFCCETCCVKVDPTDPCEVTGVSLSLQTFSGTLDCCGAVELSGGPYSWNCTSTLYPTCFPKCPVSMALSAPGHPEYTKITMNCPP